VFDVNVLLFVTNLIIIALCGGIYMIMPQLTRKSYLFGVKIPPEQSNCPEAMALKRSFVHAWLVGVLLMLALCVIQFVALRELTLLATLYLPLLVVPASLAAFVPNWKKAIRLKEEKGWQVSNALFAETSSSHTRGNLSALPWIWYALSLAVIIFTFAAAIVQYPVLPDMIAGHLNADLQPDNWVEKTWLTVLLMPVINVATLALMTSVAIIIEKARLQIDPTNPRLSFAQHRVYRKRMGHALGFLSLTTILLVAVCGLPVVFPGSPIWSAHVFWGVIAIMSISTVLLIVVQVKAGQGGCKVIIDVESDRVESAKSTAKPTAKSRTRGHGDDKFWIIGMYYYNPDDPAFFVEDRFGANLGFNYARLPVKIGIAALLIGLIALYAWLTVLFI